MELGPRVRTVAGTRLWLLQFLPKNVWPYAAAGIGPIVMNTQKQLQEAFTGLQDGTFQSPMKMLVIFADFEGWL
jgi:redox-sensitive bicupin YhaK (pirin superfamily)